MSRRRRRSAGGRRAVTLIEVLVVLALLGAMLALALPMALRSIDRNAYRTALTSVLATLDEARSHAQREGVMVEVFVERDGRRLRARERSPAAAESRPIPSIDAILEIPLTVPGTEGGPIVLFLPDGSAPISRPCVLAGADGMEAEVTVGPSMGRASARERRAVVDDPASTPDEEGSAS